MAETTEKTKVQRLKYNGQDVIVKYADYVKNIDLNLLKTVVDESKINITANTEEITKINDNVDKNTTAISLLQTDVKTNTSSISSLQSAKQDKLAAGKGIEITSTATPTVAVDVDAIQEKLIAGDFIDIDTNNIISVQTGTGISNDNNTLRVDQTILDNIENLQETKLAKNTVITAGTATKITYDENGLILSGESLTQSDIPNLSASIITSGILSNDRLSNAIPGSKIVALSITGEKLANKTITDSNIADLTITNSKLAADSVNASKIKNYTITSEKLSDDIITTTKVVDQSITTDKIADESITTAKLAKASVQTSNINDSAITTTKIADGSVTTAKLADDIITSETLKDNSVTNAKIADSVITLSKLSDSLKNKLQSTQLTASDLDLVTGEDYINTNWYASGGNTIKNKPTGVDAFGLVLIRSASGWYTQVLYSSNKLTNRQFVRTYQATTWSNWYELAKTNDIKNYTAGTGVIIDSDYSVSTRIDYDKKDTGTDIQSSIVSALAKNYLKKDLTNLPKNIILNNTDLLQTTKTLTEDLKQIDKYLEVGTDGIAIKDTGTRAWLNLTDNELEIATGEIYDLTTSTIHIKGYDKDNNINYDLTIPQVTDTIATLSDITSATSTLKSDLNTQISSLQKTVTSITPKAGTGIAINTTTSDSTIALSSDYITTITNLKNTTAQHATNLSELTTKLNAEINTRSEANSTLQNQITTNATNIDNNAKQLEIMSNQIATINTKIAGDLPTAAYTAEEIDNLWNAVI